MTVILPVCRLTTHARAIGGHLKSNTEDCLPLGLHLFSLKPYRSSNAEQENLKLAPTVKALASDKGVTPAQLALAWVLSEGKDIVPIPGTKRVRYLEENTDALRVTLTESKRKDIVEHLAQIPVAGERYAPELMALSERA
jgi:aryl-alcohol dehydrogenase-like predicted oxidoreductase